MYRVCEATGVPHPDYLADLLTVEQLQGWQDYEEQFGFRNDIFWGMFLSMFANVNKKPDVPEQTPLNFMPYTKEQELTPEEIEDKLTKMFSRK